MKQIIFAARLHYLSDSEAVRGVIQRFPERVPRLLTYLSAGLSAGRCT
jgi:hypothetical protein